MDKTNFFLSTLPFTPRAVSDSSKNIGKMSLIPAFNKNMPWAHTELELDVFGVHRKLVKYIIHSSKRKNFKKNIFLHTSQTTIDQFLVLRNFRVKDPTVTLSSSYNLDFGENGFSNYSKSA
jgi:hypothetical protein